MTTALNICRKDRRTPRFSRPRRGSVDPTGKVDRAVDIGRALRLLPGRQREAILLYYLADLPLQTVSELMGVSDGTIKTHLSRGRQTLADLLRAHREDG